MAAATVDGEKEAVVIECWDPKFIEPTETECSSLNEVCISMADIDSWDLSTILSHPIVKVKINSTRLVEESSYFRSLLCGNFSESLMHYCTITWSCEMFLCSIRFMHGHHLEITISNFLPLYQTALYFDLEMLILKCKNWLADFLKASVPTSELQFDDLVRIWEFGCEHVIDFIVELCTSYVAKNFMWAISCDRFVHLPYGYLMSCIKHPQLTVDSERHFCEALLAWVSINMASLLEQMTITEHAWSDKPNQMNFIQDYPNDILEEIRAFLLPLRFLMGKCRCRYFSGFSKQGIADTFSIFKRRTKDLDSMVDYIDRNHMRIRLTEFSKRLDLSGCPQITATTLLHSLLPQTTSVDSLLLEDIQQISTNLEHPVQLSHLPMLSFEMMREVDISKCFGLHLGASVRCFQQSFPFLMTIRMTHFLDFETKKMFQLIEKLPSVYEFDLTVDVSPLSSSNLSVLYSESVPRSSRKKCLDIPSHHGTRQILSNITKLTLEGRTDFSDYELHGIAELCPSLCYINIRGCSQVTDNGISSLLLRCRKLHSINVSETPFGKCSISALCSRSTRTGHFAMEVGMNNLVPSGVYLEMLHIGSCKGVEAASIGEVLSQEFMLKNLCLRDTSLDDHALFSFLGSSLEMLDVSNTMISSAALSHVVVNNPGIKHLEAKGCQNLIPYPSTLKNKQTLREEFISALGNNCKLEELAIGWGISFSSLDVMAPSLRFLKSINVGLGGSLSPGGIILLCATSSCLECVTLVFQVITDSAIIKLMESQSNLQDLSLCYCMGDLSPCSLSHSVPSLRKLKLERGTPWMTNDDLTQMTHNFPNIAELSLVGCTHLDVDSQKIICSGWPGLVSLHLEDCGSITTHGVRSLYECKGMENLSLFHNGPGLHMNIILDAASKLPLLRSISLDWCDASDGDYDLPNFSDRYSLSNVKISRCKLQKCTLDVKNMVPQKRPVHKETLVLVWNSNTLQKTVVKERI